jgi:DNA (cytosine-5)-methyltransferase 1
MKALKREDRAPRLIVLENVYGALTSHEGKDFLAICSALCGSEYRFGALVINAREFVPQSRQRVFFVAVSHELPIPMGLTAAGPHKKWHPPALVEAFRLMPSTVCQNWVWWSLRAPPLRNTVFADVIEETPTDVVWHSPEETAYILGMMSPVNRAKVEAAKLAGRTMVGGVYRRTRPDEDGVKQQRAEVRFDDVSGCLRTPSGGSSRQTILLVKGDNVRSRLLSPREAARLMGLDDDYKLPHRYNDAYHVAGDGVCAPVVRHLAASLLEPILAAGRAESALIAAE